MYQGYEWSQERRGDENSSFVGTVRQHIYNEKKFFGKMSGSAAAQKQGHS